MYLKTLEVQGFKSFAEKISLSFHAGLTAVVGPNGSGKSNIADAVRWVLGEQSAKTLRGGKMEDVIFAGTQYRKPLGFAAVSITFDNADGTLPIGYSEVTVTRRIYRSGESEYLLNKTACRLKDIHELFMNTGIGREGYSIIGQGRIDEILSNRSEERRAVFEEAAGITKYKVRKREAERKLEATSQNLERVGDIISELDAQLGPLQEQAETAKKYLTLSEELKTIEVAAFLETVEKTRVRVEELTVHRAELIDRIAEENAALEKIKYANTERTQKLEFLRAKQSQAEVVLRNIEIEQENINHQLQLNEEKTKHAGQTLQSFGEDLAGYAERSRALDLELEKRRKRIASLERDAERFAADLREVETQLAEVLESLGAVERETEETKQRIMDQQDVLSDKRIAWNRLKNDIENTEDRKKKLGTEAFQVGRERDRLTMTQEDIAASLRETRADLAAEKGKFSRVEIEVKEKTARMDALRAKREEATREHGAKTSRHHVLQDLEENLEGYSHSVKALLSACRENPLRYKGIHGALAQLIRVDPEFETAMEVCLGGALQNIVTEDENDAKQAIELLKQRHLGRATFLPIRAVKARSLEDTTLHIAQGMTGFLGTADEYVKTEPAYEGIVKNLLARTLVVENMDAGIAMARRFDYGLRIVTCEGELLNAGGSMSGGSQPARNASLLGRQRLMHELEEDMKRLSSEMTTLEMARKKEEAEIVKVQTEAEDLRRRISELELIRLRDESHSNQLSDQMQRLSSRQDLMQVEEAELEKGQQTLAVEMTQIAAEITDVEGNISRMREEVAAHQNKNREEQKKRDDIHADVNDYRVSVLSVKESLVSMQEQLLTLETDKQSLAGSLEKRASEKKRIEATLLDIAAASEGFRKKGMHLQEENTGAGFALEAAQEEVRATEEAYSGLLDDMANHNKEILTLSEESGKLDTRLAKYEAEMENISTRLWDEYELTLATAEPFRNAPDSVRASQSRIVELKQQIRALGVVNVAAIEDYTKTKERHLFMTTQRDDLVGAQEKLHRVIHDITLVMKRQFLEQFELINKNFSIVFRELFEGGAAEVQLADTDNVLESGIDVIVQPPGKKLQNMMLLSGGERAMVAISLIFAILRMRPAPFYLLDEIEASLDDANVFKFADYIRRYTDNIQFLVITHRKGTMEAADILYGVTMQEHGVSNVVSMRMEGR